MHKKSFIIGFLVLCIGSGMLWWLHSEYQRQEEQANSFKEKYGSETREYIKKYDEWMLLPVEKRTELPSWLDINANKDPEQIRIEQNGRLMADMDKLAVGGMTVYPFADDFYGQNWQDEIAKYKKQKEWREFIYTSSIVCVSIGGIITGWILLLNFARALIKMISGLMKRISRGSKTIEESQDNDDDKSDNKEDETNNKDNNEQLKQDNNFKDLSNVLVNSGWQYSGSFGQERKAVARQRKRIPLKSRANLENKNEENNNESSKTDVAKQPDNTSQKDEEKKVTQTQEKTKSETVISSNVDISDKKSQSNPIDTTLRDLTQQVSAIREYAANQQNRLKRFQDGYDWNIIKTFCLRIIRCIDNIENRIDHLSENDGQVKHLEEIRDELVFALESSGIEQFEPEVNSDYRGQEKFAEAVKEKKHCEEPEKKGKIEKVMKPGYQFYVDEENVRIVRPAQVRLFA